MGLDVIWLHKGSVPLPAGLSAEGGLSRLEDALNAQVHGLRVNPDRLEFEAIIFFPRKLFGPAELQPYNGGVITVEAAGDRLVARYCFSLAHLLGFCLFAAAMMGLFALSRSPLEGAKVAALSFGFLYGGNYLIGAMRASGFVASALHAGEAEEYFSAGDKIGCSLILALIIAFAIWVTWTAFG